MSFYKVAVANSDGSVRIGPATIQAANAGAAKRILAFGAGKSVEQLEAEGVQHWTIHMEAQPTMCPECKAGKHQNCDGNADIDEENNFIPCDCRDVAHNITFEQPAEGE